MSKTRDAEAIQEENSILVPALLLTQDNLCSIFEFLSYKDIYSCAQVCKDWNKAALKELLWQRLWTRDAQKKDWKPIASEKSHRSMVLINLFPWAGRQMLYLSSQDIVKPFYEKPSKLLLSAKIHFINAKLLTLEYRSKETIYSLSGPIQRDSFYFFQGKYQVFKRFLTVYDLQQTEGDEGDKSFQGQIIQDLFQKRYQISASWRVDVLESYSFYSSTIVFSLINHLPRAERPSCCLS